MSNTEILAELPKLKAEERTEVFKLLYELQDKDLLAGIGPAETEKRMLGHALEEFQRDGNIKTPWPEVVEELRSLGSK